MNCNLLQKVLYEVTGIIQKCSYYDVKNILIFQTIFILYSLKQSLSLFPFLFKKFFVRLFVDLLYFLMLL